MTGLALAVLLSTGGLPVWGAPADVVPGQVPEARIVHAAARATHALRGDFEAPSEVLVVYSDMWPSTTAAIAEQILASGAGLVVVAEHGVRRARVERWLAQLDGGEGSARRVELLDELVDTPWVRDWGPLQLRSLAGPSASGGSSLWLDPRLAGDARPRDEGAGAWLAAAFEIPRVELDMVLDGGAVVSNGAGLCVLSREFVGLGEVEDQALAAAIGAMGCAAAALVPTLVGEQTKHADMIMQFVGPGRLIVADLVGVPAGDEDPLRLAEAVRGVGRAAAGLGVELEVVAVPTPAAARGRNPRTYVNGLRLRDRYLMPSYPEHGEAAEAAAEAAIARALAGEVRVVRVDASEMIAAGGAIHCASLGLFP